MTGNFIAPQGKIKIIKGRQGSPNGRTLLMSPAMVAAAAISGKVCDVRDFLKK